MQNFSPRLVITPLVTAVALALSLTACDLAKDLPLGKTFTSRYLCSFMFTSGMDRELTLKEFIAPQVQPFPLIWDVQVNEEERIVTVGDHIFLNEELDSKAFYREGMGCTLQLDQDREIIEQHTVTLLAPPVLPEDQPWPRGTAGIDTSELPNLNTEAMNRAMDLAFEDPETYPMNTSSLLVAHNGKLIAERYEMGATKDTAWLGWSMTKTVTATLLGILSDDGLVDIDEPAPIPAWKGTEKEQITLRDIIQMSSGLDYTEEYGSTSDATIMLYQEPSHAAYTASRPLIAEPGTRFNYSTGDTSLLSKVIQDHVGGTTQSAYDFFQKELFHKVGVRSALIEVDTSGVFVGGAYGYMTPRDWLRLGQLFLQRGYWDGTQVVSPEWIDFLTRPSPSAYFYGGQLWLNNQGAEWPQVPHDAYLFAGHQGQRMAVVPSENLVVLRTGVTENITGDEWADFLNLGPTIAAIIEVVRNAR